MTPALEVQNLRYCYPEGGVALDGLSFSVGPDESVAILGPNGAGKSTLLLHLNGLLPEKPRSPAAIRVFGEEVTSANLAKIRQHVGLLFQDPDDQLLSATVFEDVAFGPRQLGLEGQALSRRVDFCLGQVGLDGFESRSPDRLSHGEKRRVCLAGVLACEPRILVLDEPTSDLDPRARREFKHLLRSLPGAKIIATHDLEFAVDLCPRVLILDGGKLIADGRALELLADERLMLQHGLEKPHCLQHAHPH